MKKYLIAVVLMIVVVFGAGSAPVAEAAALTSTQIHAIVSLLQSFGADQSAINNVSATLSGTPTGPRACYLFATNLRIGDKGPDVAALQKALRAEGFDVSSVDGDFDEQTGAAVVGFQEKYRADVLTPNGLARGSGYVGPATRVKLNILYRCNVDITPTITSTTEVYQPLSIDSAISGTVSLVGASEDKVFKWGESGRTRSNDWKWSVSLSNTGSSVKTIKRMVLVHNIEGEGWATDESVRNPVGKALYLLGTTKDACASCDPYNMYANSLAHLEMRVSAGVTKSFYVYGQPGSWQFDGGYLLVEFTDNTAAKISIPASDITPNNSTNGSSSGTVIFVPPTIILSTTTTTISTSTQSVVSITASSSSVVSGGSIKFSFRFPTDTTSASLYFACPIDGGVTRVTTGSSNTCNTYLNVLSNTDWTSPFFNSTSQVQYVLAVYNIRTASGLNYTATAQVGVQPSPIVVIQPTITVTEPKNSYYAPQNVAVVWSSNFTLSTLRIEACYNNKTNCTLIHPNFAGATSTRFVWSLDINGPYVGKNDVQIKVTDFYYGVSGYGPAIKILAPVIVAPSDDAFVAKIVTPGSDSTFKVGSPIEFEASLSGKYSGTPTYEWNFGDGDVGRGPGDAGKTYNHPYYKEGIYEVTLKVTDATGLVSTLSGVKVHISGSN